MTAVGIDFGTTNCVVSLFENGETKSLRVEDVPLEWGELGHDKLLPSVFGLDGDEHAFGWKAKLLPPNLKVEAIKRFMAGEDHTVVGDKTFTLEKISTLLFAQLRKSAAQESGVHFTKSVVTIPANSRGIARKKTRNTAAMGQVNVLALINEPTAAAMAATLYDPTPRRVMVVDWGGGTLDVTILDTHNGVFTERTSAGIATLGGVDFDAALMKWLQDNILAGDNYSQAEKNLLHLEVERAKILLSTQNTVTLRLPQKKTLRLSRKNFNKITEHLIQKAREPLERCMQDVAEIDPVVPVDSLILVGGTAQIPAVRDFVVELTQLPIQDVSDPLTATSHGAAVASAILQGELPDHQFSVSTQHALGVLAVSELDEKPHFSTIIPRNQSLPAKGTERYSPVIDNQEWLNLVVVEGDATKVADISNTASNTAPSVSAETNLGMANSETANSGTGTTNSRTTNLATDPTAASGAELQHWRVPIANPKPMKDILFDITYRYDVDGIIHVDVTNPLDESTLLVDEVLNETANGSTIPELSPENLLPDELRQDDLTREVIEARTKIAPFISDYESKSLLDLCDRVVATKGDDVVLLQALRNFKERYEYLI